MVFIQSTLQIWNAVLQKLDKSGNIESCSSASPFFRHLLQDKWINKLVLPKVFKILAKCYESVDKNDSKSPFMETNVNNMPCQRSQDNDDTIKPMTGLMKCRLVCKSWNAAIQSVYETFPRFQFRMDLDQPKRSHIFTYATERFEQQLNLTPQKFLQHFDTTHYNSLEDKPKKNPFLGRCVSHTNYRNRDDFQAHFHDTLDILRKYGKEIWYLRLTCYDEIEGPPMQLAEFYREFKQMTELMCNLKLLYISLSRRPGRGGDHNLSIPRNWPTANELQALKQEICENPFIKLPNLKYLSTEYIPTSVFNEIITKNEQISQLEVRRQSFHGSYLIFSEYLLNLRELSLEICTLSDLKKFENCQVPLNLEKLHFYYKDPAPFVPWSRIFTAIENKVNVEICTELLVQLPVPVRDLDKKLVLGESLGYRLNLTKLKIVTIFDDNPFCLDFLLSSKNCLREIVIRSNNNNYRRGSSRAVYQHQINRDEYADFEDKQIIKFLGWKEKMEKSNISTELHRLKKLTFIRCEALGGRVRYEYRSNQIKICKLN